jgi:hypothetical protein
MRLLGDDLFLRKNVRRVHYGVSIRRRWVLGRLLSSIHGVNELSLTGIRQPTFRHQKLSSRHFSYSRTLFPVRLSSYTMEDSKLQALADSLSKHAGRKGLGTGGGQYSWVKTSESSSMKGPEGGDGLPKNELYSHFVKEGSYDPNSIVKDGDGRAIKKDFSDLRVLSEDGSSDNADTKAKKRASKKAAKLEAKRQAKLEEKREAKKLAKLEKAKASQEEEEKASDKKDKKRKSEAVDEVEKPKKKLKKDKKKKNDSKENTTDASISDSEAKGRKESSAEVEDDKKAAKQKKKKKAMKAKKKDKQI